MTILDAALTGTPAAAQTAGTAVSHEVELSLWDLCLQGGPLMIVIALLSVMCVYIFIERAIVVNRAAKEDDTFMRRIRDYIHEGRDRERFQPLPQDQHSLLTPDSKRHQSHRASCERHPRRCGEQRQHRDSKSLEKDSPGSPPQPQAPRCSDSSAL